MRLLTALFVFLAVLVLVLQLVLSDSRVATKPSSPTAVLPSVPRGARCQIYQFRGTDSAARHLALTRLFRPDGRLLQERFTTYRDICGDGFQDGTLRYHYQDTLLVACLFTTPEGDQTKTLYHHDRHQRRVRQEHFTYERRLRKDVDKGLGGRDGCTVDEADYELHRTWEKTSSIEYLYDARGRIVSDQALKLHFSTQNRYTWTYDRQDRVQTSCSYEGPRRMWVERYSYFAGGYRFTRTWYGADGRPTHLQPEEANYSPLYTVVRYQNRTGQLEREETVTAQGTVVARQRLYYNHKQQVVRTVCENAQGAAQLTHVYVYR
jgi:hypothetical protein